MFAEGLAQRQARSAKVQILIREGLDVDQVRNALWNYLAIDHHERLVLHQNWTLDAYTRWLTAAITDAVTQCGLSRE